MSLLALETSSRTATVAWISDGAVVCIDGPSLGAAGESQTPATGQHARGLALQVRALLSAVGARPNDCRAVAVSSGPGSFTGLRVGITFAKTWAYALGIPLIEVSTFDVLAAQVPLALCRAEVRLDVIAEAQRGDLFVQSFSRVPDFWQAGDEIRIVSGTAWRGSLSPEVVVQGPGLDVHEGQSSAATFVSPEFRQPHAATVARLGERKFHEGQFADLFAFEPRYIRRSAAEEKAANR